MMHQITSGRFTYNTVQLVVYSLSHTNTHSLCPPLKIPVEITVFDYDQTGFNLYSMTNGHLEEFLNPGSNSILPNNIHHHQHHHHYHHFHHKKVRWINCHGISFDVIKILAIKFKLHPLALLDIFAPAVNSNSSSSSSAKTKAQLDEFNNHIMISLCRLFFDKRGRDVGLAREEVEEGGSRSYLFREKIISTDPNHQDIFKRPSVYIEQCFIFILPDGTVYNGESEEWRMDRSDGKLIKHLPDPHQVWCFPFSPIRVLRLHSYCSRN